MSTFNFEDYRQPWETGPHWELKREFMEKYQNDFSEDRLLCLAQAYSNIELMHCSYPDPVMLQVHELSKSLHGCRRFREASKLKKEQNSLEPMKKGKRNLPDEDSNKPYKFIKFCSAVKPDCENVDNLHSSNNNTSNTDPISDGNSDCFESKAACSTPELVDTHHLYIVDKNIDEGSSFVLCLAHSSDLKLIKAVSDRIKKLACRRTPFEEIENAICDSDLHSFVCFKFDNSVIEHMPICLCKFYIGNTLISIGRENNERNARTRAAEYAMEILSNLSDLPCKTLNDLKDYWLKRNVHFSLQHKECCTKNKLVSNLNSAKDDDSCSVQGNSAIHETGKESDKTSLHFWLNLAQEVKKHGGKNSPATKILDTAVKSVSSGKIFYYNFSEELNTPLHSRIFCCNMVLEKTLVCQGKDTSKKKAKLNASVNGVTCLLNLINWHKEHFDNFEKSKKVQIVLNPQDPNENLDMSSLPIDMNASILPDKGVCDISTNSEINSNVKLPLLTTAADNRATSKRMQKGSRKSNAQLIRENVIKKYNDSVKDETESTEICKNYTIVSSSESVQNTSENFYRSPSKINERLLYNSYSRELVVFDTSAVNSVCQQTPASLLNYSASFCRKEMTYQTDEILSDSGKIEKYRLHVLLDGEVVGTGEALTKTEAKTISTYCALENLRKTVYTIKVKNELEEGFVISRSQVTDANFSSNAVSDDNIGCKMMKLMGWEGGGIGKKGGITEPITASDHQFHQGLGFSKDNGSIRNFKQKIEALITEFSKSNTTSDLIFSTDFSKEERKDIHKIAIKHHVNSNSRGKGHQRQLYLRRKLPIKELLNLIVQAGGSTPKYELVDRSLE